MVAPSFNCRQMDCLSTPRFARGVSRRGRSSRSGGSRRGPRRCPREVLVEQNQILPVRVGIELLRPGLIVDRALAVFVAQEHARETARNLRRHFPPRHHLPRSRRIFDLEIVAVEVVELLRRASWNCRRTSEWSIPLLLAFRRRSSTCATGIQGLCFVSSRLRKSVLVWLFHHISQKPHGQNQRFWAKVHSQMKQKSVIKVNCR